ncbi:MAG: hypothetical protein ACUVV5_00475 [Candidatus Aminicenantales bacterium]
MVAEKVGESREKSDRNKKINKMTLEEIEKKLEEIKTSMGGHSSRYARELLRRREILRSR